MNRPTETLTALVASLVAAGLVITRAYFPETVDEIDADVTAAIVLLLSWTATVVTWIVARRLRNPASPLTSAPDGSVQPPRPMSDYRVYAKRSSKKLLKQKFYVTIASTNGETLFTSERYTNQGYAVELGQKFAMLLDGNFINAT